MGRDRCRKERNDFTESDAYVMKDMSLRPLMLGGYFIVYAC